MKALFIELNEFSLPVLQEGVKNLPLPAIEKILSFPKSETITDDTYDSDFLEPWVQWVSIHTGIPSSVHKIKHLGDVPSLQVKQYWENLSERGITSGIWGAMNATRASAEKCLFFLPDPWTFSEEAYPLQLNEMLLPLRASAKNYVEKSFSFWFSQCKRFFSFLRKESMIFPFVKEIPRLIYNLFKYKKKPFAFISFLEMISSKLFLQYKQRFNPDISILFLNSLAHLQHHQWNYKKLTKNSPIGEGLIYLDKMLTEILASTKDELIIVANALSQVNTLKEKPWVLYRQKNQNDFVKAIGLENVKVESHMTHDAHLLFPSRESCNKAYDILQSAQIMEKPLFHLERYQEDACKLFYKLCFTDALPENAFFSIKNKKYPFFSFFTKVVQRTGKHIPEGSLFCNQPIFPTKIYNHEIPYYIEKVFI